MEGNLEEKRTGSMETGAQRMISRELGFARICVQVQKLGADYHLTLQGGACPHIGCTVLTIPRESLTGDGSISCTSSVLNVTGHKDEQICRFLAEAVAKKKQAVTVCTGGFHMDHITEEQIRQVIGKVREIADEI